MKVPDIDRMCLVLLRCKPIGVEEYRFIRREKAGFEISRRDAEAEGKGKDEDGKRRPPVHKR